MEPTFKDIEDAALRLEKVLDGTVMIKSRTFSSMSGREVYLKLENLQKTGSFKIRGAYNRILNISEDERVKGVITASAGNHAQGVAYSASALGIKSTVVMPEYTPIAKVAATRGYGAQVLLHGSDYDSACKKAMEICENSGMTFVHAFDDPHVIAGQGTVAIEMLKENPALDVVVVPLGGGGLISGIALAAKTIKPGVKVIGVEAAGFDAMRRSKAMKQLVEIEPGNTIADGIAVKRPGELTFSMIQKYVDDIITVTEDEIASTILMLLERAKLVSEGAGSAALAAVLHEKLPCDGGRVGVVISGGNIDINLISMIIHKGLLKSGRKLEIKTVLKDKPGQLRVLLDLLAGANVNIVSVNHNREREMVELGFAEVDIVLETNSREHAAAVCNMLAARGYKLEQSNL
jgi:threonine dehydratase